MALMPIIKLPDRRLKQVSAPVSEVTDETRAFLDDMLATMYDAPGIGLAAVQVGRMERMVVIDIANRDDGPPDPMCMINPEIVWRSEEMAEYEEGCLSIPDVYDKVSRPAAIRVRYLDRDGKARELDCDGLLATCVQHEVDHLDGVLFIDYLPRLKRERIIKKFIKQARQEERV